MGVQKLISYAKDMNFKLLLVFALVALAVAEAQKKGNGRPPKGPKEGGNGANGSKNPTGPGGEGGSGGNGKGPKNPTGPGGDGGSGGNGKGPKNPKGPGGNSGEDSAENSGEAPPPGPVGPDSEIAVCTAATCTCESGDPSKGFQTYGFVQDGVQRCFTVFHPLVRAGESLPVVISSQCYGKDNLQSISMTNENTADNKAAARYGFARIGVSTPDGHWTFGNDNIVNDLKPMPCADEDSKDIAYMRKIMKFVEDNSEQFDATKVYAEGFYRILCFLHILHSAFL